MAPQITYFCNRAHLRGVRTSQKNKYYDRILCTELVNFDP